MLDLKIIIFLKGSGTAHFTAFGRNTVFYCQIVNLILHVVNVHICFTATGISGEQFSAISQSDLDDQSGSPRSSLQDLSGNPLQCETLQINYGKLNLCRFFQNSFSS